MEMNDNTYIGEDNTRVNFAQLDATELPDVTEIDVESAPDATEIVGVTETANTENNTEITSSDYTEVDYTQIDTDQGAELTSIDNTSLEKTALDLEFPSLKTLKKTNFGHIKKPVNNLTFAPRTTPLQDVKDYLLSTIPLERFKPLKRAETPNFSSSYYKVIIVGVIAWFLCVLGVWLL